MKAAIVGGGVIGGGWAARFLLNGWDVAVFDPDPQAERKIGEVLANARRALPAIYDQALPAEGTLRFESDMATALAGADWVQESVPERLDLKHRIHDDIGRHLAPGAIVGSSTSGFKPSELNGDGRAVIVAHPFNPVYLLPLVELVGDAAICAKAAEILRAIGMAPLTLRREIDAHIADRLLEAVWRESLWLIKDGICTTEELDDAIRLGFGLRWAQMGLFETYRVAGGEAGMRHFMAQFGPALEWPWTKLMDVPEFTDDLVDLIAGQSDAQSGHMSIRDLERLRDDNLVAILRGLKPSQSGAGGVITGHEARLQTDDTLEGLPVTADRQIPVTWTDYNGHMNEAAYALAASNASDRFMELIGADQAYVAAGGSYFTAENHITYLAEMHAGERLKITTQVIEGQGKKMHLLHRILNGSGEVTAIVESLLLHMDLNARRTSLPSDEVARKLAAYAEAHADLPLPERAGTRVGRR